MQITHAITVIPQSSPSLSQMVVLGGVHAHFTDGDLLAGVKP